jgi:Ca2+-transporting ATPase
VPIAGLALIPLLFGLPLVFWPLHIAFLEMVIDPVCSIVFEAEGEERDTMRRPPRDPAAPLLTAGFCRLEPPAGSAGVGARRRAVRYGIAPGAT